jgi:hypothetical protein
MKVGDVSRRRRFQGAARLRWYAHHRAVRFARRMGGIAWAPCHSGREGALSGAR